MLGTSFFKMLKGDARTRPSTPNGAQGTTPAARFRSPSRADGHVGIASEGTSPSRNTISCGGCASGRDRSRSDGRACMMACRRQRLRNASQWQSCSWHRRGGGLERARRSKGTTWAFPKPIVPRHQGARLGQTSSQLSTAALRNPPMPGCTGLKRHTGRRRADAFARRIVVDAENHAAVDGDQPGTVDIDHDDLLHAVRDRVWPVAAGNGNPAASAEPGPRFRCPCFSRSW